MEVKKGNVIHHENGNRKYVATEDRELDEFETIVCEKPHEDEDFSYLCWRDHCRCMQ